MTRVLGPMVNTHSIGRSMKSLLSPDRGLIGQQLDEITRQDRESPSDPVDRIERPRSVRVRQRVGMHSDDQLPAILIISPGTIGDPYRDGEGVITATYAVGVCALTQSTDEDVAAETAAIMARAGAAVILQCLARLDDRISNVTWVSESSTDADIDDNRSRFAVTNELHVTVRDVIGDTFGPDALEAFDPLMGDPAVDAGDLVTVETTELTVTPVEEIPA